MANAIHKTANEVQANEVDAKEKEKRMVDV
jgi:hypothetical protein